MNIFSKKTVVQAVALFAGLSFASAEVQGSPYSTINAAAAADPVKSQRLRGGVFMLSGSGGNIGVIAGPNGLFMVDAGISISRSKIEAALRSVGRGPVRYVVDTHWHWDHADGNGWLRRSGATILADPHTRHRLMQTIRVVEWEHTFTPAAARDLPNVVVAGNKVMHFAGETIHIRHYQPGHTDGDLSVYFQKADVLQTGDTFWNGMYPFIDYVGGGGINGAIRAANVNLTLAGPRTLVIPGHGHAGDRAKLVAFRDMLVSIRGSVRALKAQGRTIEQVVAAKPTASFDAKWGQALINGDLFTRLVYRGV
ncbi:MBL fold metallo-hydrolase [Sphingomonas glacialis]|uniref:MBL fold metallo-hydrolase n=1 Tax=Sphingomonas glacialis TaxID=658225 RepID=A0A502FTP5_9SPHN|nr:MBL fold metallo-hydrolase [Sphingomonas glacialis]TPG52632.1 MBL fold metallo-hydrolase [Sphingomonas glacialis]